MADKISFFASGNGDTVLLQTADRTVLTDICYRATRCQDPDDDDAPDFAGDIRAACTNDHLDIFVLTHPDKDHLCGFGDLFHLGHPDDWTGDPDDGVVKIVVDEIWCSPYSADPHYVTDISKPVLDEIKRRKKLMGSPDGDVDGNRLVIMSTDSHETGTVTEGLSWRLLAPTPDEADIPKSEDPDHPNSSNQSSLIIRWTVTVGGKDNFILLGGDSTVEIWERIYGNLYDDDPDSLAWHILMAIHHCSRRSIGRVENRDSKDEKFVPSEEAETALGEQRGDGYVVASSNRIRKAGPTPPSYHAKNRYLKILARGNEVTDAVRSRFICTGGDADNDNPEHVVFRFSASGPTRAMRAAMFVSTTDSSSGRGGGYG